MKDASEDEQEEDFIVSLSKKNVVPPGPSRAEREEQLRSMMEDEGRCTRSNFKRQ